MLLAHAVDLAAVLVVPVGLRDVVAVHLGDGGAALVGSGCSRSTPNSTNEGTISRNNSTCMILVCLRTKSNMRDSLCRTRRGLRQQKRRTSCSPSLGWWVLTGSNRRPTPCKGAALPAELSTPPDCDVSVQRILERLAGTELGNLGSLDFNRVRRCADCGRVRAARLPTAKVPKPTSDTEPPFFSVVLTAPIIDSSARVAAALEMSACFAMCSISSVLFTGAPRGEKVGRLLKIFVSRPGPPRCGWCVPGGGDFAAA